ncbi:hypothetical protein BDN70DRAFT_884449 [Pholiota conissans]|uniref:Uncharacterized protein n=1 Tax=Pholiota conissans TaxID=109636 RepID=A0A9P5YTC1_9AGAR|nr:hypothetical protein BDN70DRAFT_884449 [Pholiota conissans]
MILSVLILSKPDSKLPMDIDSLEDILDIKDIRRTLIDMHSLIYVPPPDVPSAVYLHHKAFGDFLMDKARSGRYYIDRKERHTTIVEGLVKLLQDINTSRFHHRHCVPFFIDHLQFHAQRRTLRSSVISSTASTAVIQVIGINNERNGGLKRRRVEDGCSEEYRIYKRRC